MFSDKSLSRRVFLGATCAAWAAEPESIIDIHQHTVYGQRDGEQLVLHQRAMGVTRTVLLPVGTRPGLAPGAGGNQSAVDLTRKYPQEFVFFANAVPDDPNARREIEKFLKAGALGIGEQKYAFECDSEPMQRIFAIAQDHQIPVLLHFQHGAFNMGIERFYKVVEKYPKAKFIGHAQTWWGNIDRKHDQTVMYPKGPVIPGGITDRLLSNYPNVYADTSAGSGLNALLRDEDHARAFLARHQDKLMFGSDCSDSVGSGSQCSGSQCIAALKRLAPSGDVAQKIFHQNAVRILKIETQSRVHELG
jgi:predicted TIM-barrel fold metal-dependent hydrolase